MLNVAVLMGRLVADPELRTTQSGTSVATARIAVERNFKNQNGDRETDFITIVAWRGTADMLCKWFHKGDMVAVHGSIQTRNYEDKDGNKRTAVEVVADRVSFCGGKSEGKSEPTSYAPAKRAQQTGLDLNPKYPTAEEFEEIGDSDLPWD